MRLDTTIALASGTFVLGALFAGPIEATQQTALAAKPRSKAEVISVVKTIEEDLARLNSHQRAVFSGYRSLLAKAEALSASAKRVADLQTAGGGGQDQLLNATKEMQEMNQSFLLLYNNLKSKLNDENRKFLAVSSLMKNKHETAKNMIANIR